MEETNFVRRLIYLFKTFILIGSTSFGGYMSLIAMMRDRMVSRDKSIDDNIITEGISLASMLPGPVAVNVVAFTGFHIAGVLGALVSISAVLIPSLAMVLILSIIFFNSGDRFAFGAILAGVFPVVAAIILATGIGMGKRACKRKEHYVIATLCFVVPFFIKGYWIIVILLVLAALVGMMRLREDTIHAADTRQSWRPVLISLAIYAIVITATIFLSRGTVIGQIVKEFSQVSLTLFGGGYVMVPLLKTRFVDQLEWITNAEFIYGISIGQITPGPILTSAGFFGYKMAGLAGAIIAILAIYLPSSMLMILLSNIIIPLRSSRFFQAGLSGLKAAIVGIILYSAIAILSANDMSANWIISLVIATVAFWLTYKYNVISVALIITGGVIGFFVYR